MSGCLDVARRIANSGESGDAASVDAMALLNLAACRLMLLDHSFTIGIWGDLDGPELRGAIAGAGLENLPVVFLEGEDLPERYRVRSLQVPPRTADITFQRWLQSRKALVNAG